MGEYAKFNGGRIKIGTSNTMYYLRYDDRHKVQAVEGNVDPQRDTGLYYRLPFIHEDGVAPGDYSSMAPGVELFRNEQHPHAPDSERLVGFAPDGLEPGRVQLRNDFGLLVSVPCYHGLRLPEIEGLRFHWNGRRNHLELRFVKDTGQGLRPVIECRACQNMWSFDWDDILPWVQDKKLLARLKHYAKQSLSSQ